MFLNNLSAGARFCLGGRRMLRIHAAWAVGIACLSLMPSAAAAQGLSETRASGLGLAPDSKLSAALAPDADLQAVPTVFEPPLMPQTFNPFPEGVMNTLPQTRPAKLFVLYASFIGLQAYDGYSTITGTAGGARETNPLLGKFTDN